MSLKGQEFIHSAIEAEMSEGGELEFIKHLAYTDLVKIKEYPAVLIEEDPFEVDQEDGNDYLTLSIENYSIAVIDKIPGPDVLTSANYISAAKSLKQKVEKIIEVIIEKLQTTNDIASVDFGKGEPFNGTIDSVPVRYYILPVEVRSAI